MPSMRTVTVLFTDLVDSSGLFGALDPQEAEDLRHTYFSLLRGPVAAHGGEEVKNLGDGIMAVFESATDGLACAVDLQRGITRHNRRPRQHRLLVRVGLSMGDAVREADDFFGVPVVQAARLCAAAEGGQVLVPEQVRLLAAADHRFRSLGDLTLKGFEKPVPAFEVRWDLLEPSPIPLQGRLQVAGQLEFAGRAGERHRLTETWEAVTRGERRVVLVGGEPGIGKTRLATEVALAAHRHGATVLYGHCDSELGAPYQPFTEALRHYVVHCPAEELTAHVAIQGSWLARLVPELALRVADVPSAPSLEPDTERYRLFDAVAALLTAASEVRPVVLVLDDLHWAGTPALLLLRHIVASTDAMAVLVIANYRSAERSHSEALAEMLADLRIERGVERIGLTGLSLTEVETLVAAATGASLGDNGPVLARALADETGGNPFFVVEMLRHLTESGAIGPEGERWPSTDKIAAIGVPDTVREVLIRRLHRFPSEVVEVLEAACVIGREFDLAVLRRVLDASEEDTLAALEEATRAALVTEVGGIEGRFSFSHVLVRQVLYDDLDVPRRERLHRRIGEAIEETRSGDPAELAHHWLQASHGRNKALDYSRRAGERALAGLAYEEAAVHYERALAVLERQGLENLLDRINVLLRLADAWRRGGDPRYRDIATQAAILARSLGMAEPLARAALVGSRPGSWYTSIGEVDEGLVALYDESIAGLGDVDTPLRARLLAQLGVELYWSPLWDRRTRLSDQAVAIARRLGDMATLAQVLIARVISLWGPATLEERLALTAELAELAGRLDNPEVAFISRLVRALALFESAELRQSNAELQSAIALAEQLRQPFYTWLIRIIEVMRALMAGPAGVETAIGDAFALGQRIGQTDAPAVFSSQVGQLRWDQGRFGEVEGAMAAYVETMPRIPAWRGALALVLAETGQLDEAREHFEILAERDFALPPDWVWMVGMSTAAEVCAFLGDAARARILYTRLRPVASRLVVVGNGVVCLGAASRLLGLLAATAGDRDTAVGHFEHALQLNNRVGAKPFLVRTYRAYAAMLIDCHRPGDEQRAAHLHSAGLALAEELGMPVEAARLRELGSRVVDWVG
jgi:class 3 adenylate cyclase/tetratricopeptide (TPR) repeat protein